jgi:hypothetical protein
MLNMLSIPLTYSVVRRETTPPSEKVFCGLLRLLKWGTYGK